MSEGQWSWSTMLIVDQRKGKKSNGPNGHCIHDHNHRPHDLDHRPHDHNHSCNAHHAVHGKRRTECPCRHPSRRGLLPEGQRRLQPEDGGGDDGDNGDGDEDVDDKSYNNKKMKMVMTVTTAGVVPKRYQKLQSVAA